MSTHIYWTGGDATYPSVNDAVFITTKNLGDISSAVRYFRPAADLPIVSSTSPADHSFISFPVTAGRQYQLDVALRYVTDNGISVQFFSDGIASASKWDASVTQIDISTITVKEFTNITGGFFETQVAPDGGSASVGTILMESTFVCSASGSIYLGVAQDSSSPSGTTFLGTSYITLLDITP